MGRILFMLVAPIVLLWSTSVVAEEAWPASALEPAFQGASASVLLHNGNIMTGRVTRTGGRVRLANHGAEFWLEESMVAHVAESPAALYQWRRDSVSRHTVDSHLSLAQWCLSQKLLEQASRELLDARTLAPQDPRVAVLEQRLMRQAFPTEKKAAPAPRQTEPLAMSEGELAALPDGAVERFVRHIQPILLNNCTAGGCHATGGTNSFQLDRALLHGLSDAKSTRFNLAKALAAIDRGQPHQSPLLDAVLQPHAGREGPAFDGRRTGLQDDLLAWVRDVAQPAAADRTQSNRDQSSAGVFSLVKEKHLREEFARQASGDQSSVVRDEFDPGEFNRRYGPLSKKTIAPATLDR